MKRLTLIICLFLMFCYLSGCINVPEDEKQSTNEEITTEEITESNSIFVTESETVSVKYEDVSKSTTENNNDNETYSQEIVTEETTLSALEKLENSEVVTYYSENPNNKYIYAVAEKYGVDKVNLVALIRTKAQKPGATVLQFSGKTDESGELIKTKSELKYVYEVDDSDNTIKRAAENSSENDGYSAAESRTIFMLTKQFIVPELEKLKKEHTYPE